MEESLNQANEINGNQPIPLIENEEIKINEEKLNDQPSIILRGPPICLQTIEIKTNSKSHQEDFVKKLQYFDPQKTVCSITENNTIYLYEILNDIYKQEKCLVNFWKKEYDLTVLYDILLTNPRPSTTNEKEIILSRRDHPVTIYSLNDKGVLKDQASLKICKRGSEKFLSPLSMKLKKDGTLFGGGNSFLFMYDLHILKEKMLSRAFKKTEIISTIDIPNENAQNFDLVKDTVIVGKFDKKIALYSQQNDKVLCEMKAHLGGITHIKFMPNNNLYLFSGARKDNLVYLWDLRKTNEFVNFFERKCKTNQRMFFDISSDGNEIFLGNQDGTIVSYKILTGELKSFIKAHDDCVNSLVFLNYEHNEFLVSSSGQRTFTINENLDGDSSSSSSIEKTKNEEELKLDEINKLKNSLNFWRF